MLQRLTPTAQRIIKKAEQIARKDDQEYIDTEHVLLAIAEQPDTRAAHMLANCGITAAQLAHAIEKLVKKSLEETWVFGRLPGTPHFRNVVAKAIELADSRNAQAVAPEHLLIALASEKGSVACQALSSLKVNAAKLEKLLDTIEQTPKQ